MSAGLAADGKKNVFLLGTVLFHAFFRFNFRLFVFHIAEIACFLVFRFISHVLLTAVVLVMLGHTKHQSFPNVVSCPEILRQRL